MKLIPMGVAEKITEIDYKQIRMIDQLFGGSANSDPENGLMLKNFLVLLTFDFFRRSGMPLETFIAAFKPFNGEYEKSATYIQTMLANKTDRVGLVIPKVFVTLIDNRYVTMTTVGNQTRAWDFVSERWVEDVRRDMSPPLFTLTLSLPALYFKIAAPHLGQSEWTKLFKHARPGEKAHTYV